jgi:hypothetical protein
MVSEDCCVKLKEDLDGEKRIDVLDDGGVVMASVRVFFSFGRWRNSKLSKGINL